MMKCGTITHIRATLKSIVNWEMPIVTFGWLFCPLLNTTGYFKGANFSGPFSNPLLRPLDSRESSMTCNIQESGGLCHTVQKIWGLPYLFQLRDERDETFWQSDGAQPHTIDIQFQRAMRISEVCCSPCQGTQAKEDAKCRASSPTYGTIWAERGGGTVTPQDDHSPGGSTVLRRYPGVLLCLSIHLLPGVRPGSNPSQVATGSLSSACTRYQEL